MADHDPRLGSGRIGIALGIVAGLAVSACGASNTRFPIGNDNAKQTKNPYVDIQEARGSVFAEDGLAGEFSLSALFGEDGDGTGAPPSNAIQVNGHLWSGALDVVSFMPIESANPDSGIIKTGWYAEPETPEERFRVNVFILSGQLRADGVRVGVFRQVREETGAWIDAEPVPGTATKLEDLIVGRARELSLSASS